jgi:carbonic anhydrase
MADLGSPLTNLLENNQRWAAQIRARDPGFFAKLARQQTPEYLWIGCADSRVPANEIVGLLPGELFVHRNVGNIVHHTDMNCLAVLQYAVETLKVKHVLVCGHYGCGGVQHAMHHGELGLIDNWLRSIKDVYQQNRATLDGIRDGRERLDRLCELNVAQQVANVAHTTIVQHTWRQGRPLSIHGIIYDIHDGILRDLGFCVTGADEIAAIYRVGE